MTQHSSCRNPSVKARNNTKSSLREQSLLTQAFPYLLYVWSGTESCVASRDDIIPANHSDEAQLFPVPITHHNKQVMNFSNKRFWQYQRETETILRETQTS